MEKLVFVGKIIDLQPIAGADFIVLATVICGAGGKWRGVCKKQDFEIGSLCVVYLPDSLIPECEEMAFMKSSNWRVKMRRFKGAPSEVLIMPLPMVMSMFHVGYDVTSHFSVTRYHKPISPHLQGIAKGQFPGFIPKTDEPNYQNAEGQEGIEKLLGKPYYITEKADGSSTTAFRYKGEFGVCSRNLELERNLDNGYWKIAEKYQLEAKLPEGLALQWETCGPGIQSNPMGLSEISGFAFSGYYIPEHRYLSMIELIDLCTLLKFPMCPILKMDQEFSKEGLELLGEGLYANGKQREGVVVRSQENFDGKPISFKVINLNYEK